MSVYRRGFKCMSFLIKDEKLVEKYSENWKRVNNMIKKGLNCNSVYNDATLYATLYITLYKYIKTKIKFYNGKFNTKRDLNVICLSLILIDSVYKKDKNYYPQVFLEEFKYIIKEKKDSKFITEDIEIPFDKESSNVEI